LNNLGIFGGEYKDFDAQWYETVGVAICLTMIIQVAPLLIR
jgi:hypothetical protein